MKIEIKFPDILKMILVANIEISDSASLQEVKEKTFKIFWEVFGKNFPERKGSHGSYENVTLKDQDIEIISDDDLRERLKVSTSFQVVFMKHPFPLKGIEK